MEISSEGKLRFTSTGHLVIENFISVEVVDEIKSGVQAVTLSDGVTMFSDRQGLPRRLERFTYKDARLIALMEVLKLLLKKSRSYSKTRLTLSPRVVKDSMLTTTAYLSINCQKEKLEGDGSITLIVLQTG